MKHYIGVSIYANPTVRGFATDWFARNDDRMPMCNCQAENPQDIGGNGTHVKGCPMYAFAIEGWSYAVDRWMEMERDGNE